MRGFALGLVLLSIAFRPALAADILNLGSPFGEAYRHKFAECDAHDTFGGVPVTHLHRCTTDPSRFAHLAMVSQSENTPRTIIFESKMAHDDDGSARSCSASHGSTSQCSTTLMLQATAKHPCKVQKPQSECVPVDPDFVPYVVIPGGSAPVLGLSMGDFGMVLFRGRQVPVIVADSGPSNKIGEGSTKLLSQLSIDSHPSPIGQGVIFVLFPGSHVAKANLSPDTLPDLVKDRGTKLFEAFRKTTQ